MKINKKIFYILGLTSMLTLNGCRDNYVDTSHQKVYLDDNLDTSQDKVCLENHLDKESLDVKTLSDGTKYISDANVFYALRERFLNNNTLVDFQNIKLDDSDYIELLNNSNYLYMFDNTKIRSHLICYMMGLKKMYPELEMSEIIKKNRVYEENDSKVNINARYRFADNVEYNFSITSYFANYEMINYDVLSDITQFSKYMHLRKLDNSDYKVIEQYEFLSIEKQGLNRIKIGITSDYTLSKDAIINGNYTCSDIDSSITLNNGEDSLEVELTETQFEQFSNILTDSAKKEITVEQFLEENNELMTEIFKEKYSLFLEKTSGISYTLKKPVQ